MPGEFGNFINEKRKGRGENGEDILLKDIANAMGTTATYLSDIVKGRRNPPEMSLLLRIATVLKLDGNEAAPDLPEYIMAEEIPYVRAALRRASDKKLGNEFWKKVLDDINNEEG